MGRRIRGQQDEVGKEGKGDVLRPNRSQNPQHLGTEHIASSIDRESGEQISPNDADREERHNRVPYRLRRRNPRKPNDKTDVDELSGREGKAQPARSSRDYVKGGAEQDG